MAITGLADRLGPDERQHLWQRTLAWARLPCAYGGTGLTSFDSIRHPAYLSSVARAWHSFGNVAQVCREEMRDDIAASVIALGAKTREATNTSTEFPSTAAAASHKTRQGICRRAFFWDQPVALEDFARAAELFSSFADDLGSTRTAQRSLTSIVNSASFDKLLCDFYNPTMSTSDRVTASHFLSASCSDAVAWIHPERARIRDPRRRISLAACPSLSAPSPQSSHRALLDDRCTHPEHQLDHLGHHLFTCMHHRTIPHDNTRDRIREFCAQAGLKPIAEPRNLLHDQATGVSYDHRPDIALPGVDPQGKLLLDVTTTSVGCKTAIKDYTSATDRGGAARGAEQRKVKDDEKCLDPNSQSLMPLAFELPGRWSPISLRFFEMIKRVALQMRDLQGQRHSFWAGFWRRAKSVGLQRDIARFALNIKDQLLDKHSGAKRSYTRRFLNLGRA